MIFLYKAGSFIFATSVKSESVKKEQLQLWFWPRLQIQAWHSIPQNFRAVVFVALLFILFSRIMHLKRFLSQMN